MRILPIFMVVTALFLASGAQVHAASKAWGWWSSNWKTADFKPYFKDQKLSHRSLWDGDDWTPEAWIKDAGDEKRIIRDLYAAKIITDQFEDSDDIPVLEVGEGFLKLSNLDQRRVLKFIDHVFTITTSEENGMFYVYYDGESKGPIGLFNKHGFQSY